jgi:hypothetical protein
VLPAAIEKVACCPTTTFWFTGCLVIDGAVDVPPVLLFFALVLLVFPLVTPAQPEIEKIPNRTNRKAAQLRGRPVP